MKKTYRNKLPKGMEVECANVSIENGEIVVDVEFKEKFEPKDGDFLVIDDSIFIYNPNNEVMHLGLNGYYAGIRDDGSITINEDKSGFGLRKEKMRYATPEEKSAFLKRLEQECHKQWNAEKKRLEDIYIPKFGDIVKVVFSTTKFPRNYTICIFPNKPIPSESFRNNFFDIGISMEGKLWYKSDIGGSYKEDSIYLASESEKQELFDKLAEVGKKWNPETKQLENIRWRAKAGEPYYVVNMFGAIGKMIEEGLCKDNVYYNIGNYFKSIETARPYANKARELFKNHKTE